MKNIAWLNKFVHLHATRNHNLIQDSSLAFPTPKFHLFKHANS